MVYGIKQFEEYLNGEPFEVITDHQSLIWLFKNHDQNARLRRWMIYLQTFTFTITYRKGSNHANVDALSRPILAVEQVRYLKLEDPYKDESLLHFILHKRHKDGRSSKVIDHINKIAHQYRIGTDGNIYFNDNSIEIIVPSLPERAKIINEAHRWGHFQTESTVERIKLKFDWPSIRTDVQKAINSCPNCQANHRIARAYHPARTLDVKQIFDRIQIDLVFGLPETKDGYNGILLIVEAVSKFPFAYPIRTKTNIEIAQHLFDYVAIFGAPRQIHSDQGTEFKGVVDEMIKLIGVDHTVTAAYNPRCNGLAERFNQTLITILRKLCMNQPYDWPNWLQFALMCYRSRKHATTGETPDLLLLGRERNLFLNYDNFDLDSVNFRKDQLSMLKNIIYPETIDKIKAKQIIYQNTQNKRQNNVEIKLPKGTHVLIKDESIKAKLSPLYNNRCIVIDYDDNDNYILQNTLGERLAYGIPLQQLKVVPTESIENINEIKSINSHKYNNNNEIEYNVSWTDGSESWVNHKDIQADRLINNYFSKEKKKKYQLRGNNKKPGRQTTSQISSTSEPTTSKNNKPTTSEKKGPGRPRKSTNKTFKLLFFAQILIILISSTFCSISGNFDYCNLQQLNHITPSICDSSSFSAKSSLNLPVFTAIFLMESNVVYGDGFVCSIEEFKYEYWMNFFGAKSSTLERKYLTLSRYECEKMISENKCKDKNMICQGNTCFYDGNNDEISSYSWMTLITHITYNCLTERKTISSNSITNHLFDLPHCSPRALQCTLHNAILIWNNSIIHECPIKYIELSLMYTNDNITFYNEKTNLALKLEKINDIYTKKIICDKEFILSTEGFLKIMF